MQCVDDNNEKGNGIEQMNNNNTNSPHKYTIKKGIPAKKTTVKNIGKGNILVRTVEQDMMVNPEYYDDLEENSENDEAVIDDFDPNGPPLGTGVTSIYFILTLVFFLILEN